MTDCDLVCPRSSITCTVCFLAPKNSIIGKSTCCLPTIFDYIYVMFWFSLKCCKCGNIKLFCRVSVMIRLWGQKIGLFSVRQGCIQNSFLRLFSIQTDENNGSLALFSLHRGRWTNLLLDQLGFSVTCTRESVFRPSTKMHHLEMIFNCKLFCYYQ